ncbi:MAG: glycerol-3-phosphate cytidylyltransferase [Ignavibacteria bacterium CG2_30_36_16]|nr:D-glycero-beta-D-manno-heptose 1-phosphate adenylyltransferase [Ignavibacteria bacterium]OIP60187.1 MAG: glycerol-3-phosphate cytidylyltransferase [Ignavibacteria bacterium CG2_30_36_16]PJB01701.1 MAG: D-glycero-beta-D-manno-heptose 1-phosphate adenylyltransferase [Ignavibacteria bacterium CG_4_9_14_3_um_filter_36_18]
MNRNLSREELVAIRKELKANGRKVVFTNGCFDIIHSGHVDYLTKAKMMGDVLFVGINSDSSIKRIKGDKRPILDENERAFIVASLKAVDYVSLFDEDTPKELIEAIVPDVLVKGADWTIENIVGRDVVEANGGKVETIKFVNNQSTSNIIKKILSKYQI